MGANALRIEVPQQDHCARRVRALSYQARRRFRNCCRVRTVPPPVAQQAPRKQRHTAHRIWTRLREETRASA